jgi:transcriptional regulator with XRE-family HTH domain
MKINSNLVKKLRIAKNWSQEQLSEACGLSLRTIQRLENGGSASLESIRVLAAVFEIDSHELTLNEKEEPMTPRDAVESCLRQFANFSGAATRFEYGWFLLFAMLVLAGCTIIDERAAQIAALILLLPLLAAGARRLNAAGHSGWWQLLWFVPFGQVAVLIMMFLDNKPGSNQPLNTSLDSA